MRAGRILAAALAALVAVHAPAGAWIAQKSGGVVTPPMTQLLNTVIAGSLSNSAVRYAPVGYTNTPQTADGPFTVMPVSGAFTSMKAAVAAAPTSTQTWTVQLRRNGSDIAGAACAITSSSSPAKQCTVTGSWTVTAGDYYSLSFTPANTPSITTGSASFVFQPTTANDTVIASQLTDISGGLTTAHGFTLFDNFSPGNATTRRNSIFPDGGTIDRLYAYGSNATGTGSSYAYTIDKNSSASTVTCAVADPGGLCTPDTTHSFTITGASGGTANDDVSFRSAPSGSPTTLPIVGTAFRFVPSTAGSFIFMEDHSNSDSATLTTYYAMNSGGGTGSTTESIQQGISHAITVTKMAIKLSAAPGAAASGKKRTFTLRKNGVDTSLTCDVLETATVNTCTGSVSVSDGDLLSTSDVPTSSPALATPFISYLANR